MNHRAPLCFRAGCYACFVFAVLHLAGHLSGPAPAKNDDEASLMRLMQTVPLALPGTHRTMLELVDGFSLALVVLFVAVGALGLVAVPATSRDPTVLRRAAAVLTAGMAGMLAISMTYWFIAPTACISLTLIGFGSSWYLARAR